MTQVFQDMKHAIDNLIVVTWNVFAPRFHFKLIN